jgi:hypothetical protein
VERVGGGCKGALQAVLEELVGGGATLFGGRAVWRVVAGHCSVKLAEA